LILIGFLATEEVINHLMFHVELNGRTFVVKDVSDLSINGYFVGVSQVSSYPEKDLFWERDRLIIKSVKPGDEKIQLIFKGRGIFRRVEKVVLKILPSREDEDGDGFPDSMELRGKDAWNFRNWFIHIANSLYYSETSRWREEERDCAGFVRFCFIEALRVHNNLWVKKMNYTGPIFEDVQKYNYPNIPIAGDKPFRIVSPPFRGSQDFSYFASSRYLKEYNLTFVTKNVEEALPGDIMIYFHPQDVSFPFHMMIYMGNLGLTDDEGWVVYHTGPVEGGGELRKVKWRDLLNADPAWQPDILNPHFLGFFRFNILDN